MNNVMHLQATESLDVFPTLTRRTVGCPGLKSGWAANAYIAVGTLAGVMTQPVERCVRKE